MTEGPERAAFEAARSGDVGEVVRLLDERPDLIDARGESGVTLLHVAAEVDGVEVAEALLDRGVALEVEASWGYTPFEWAAAMASDRVARLLLDRGAERLNLWTAAALGMLDEVRARFSDGEPLPGAGRAPRPGADVTGWPEDAPYRSGDVVSDAFHIAARNGHEDVAAFLLRAGADVDARGYFGATALHWAAVAGRGEIVRWLIDAGASCTERDPRFDSTPAAWAREGGHAHLAEAIEARS